jgi:hypothetical protein
VTVVEARATADSLGLANLAQRLRALGVEG